MALPSRDSRPKESRHILIFTKYPTPGYAKTRLIPAIGADSAADVSRQLTQRVVRVVREHIKLSSHFTISRIFYSSKSPQDSSLMRDWLGEPDAEYESREELHPQSGGDLGDRLSSAFKQSFENDVNKVVVVGADIPEIDGEVLCEAFEKLNRTDVVIGPAVDGGYYLLGMKRPQPFLFEGIPWSTEKVFANTTRKASEGNLSVAELRVLRDVDRPEDLAYFKEIVPGSNI